MTASYYFKKILKKIQFGTQLGLGRFGNSPLTKISLPSIRFPVYLRKNTTDNDVLYQVFYYNSYDIKFDFEPKVIFDCGANIGLASVYFKNQYPGARIIAVEPESSNFDMLLKNTEQYGNIECLQAGIWKKSTNLRITDTGQGNWGFITEETNEEGKDIIRAVSIDELMKKYGVEQIDILKIDIESSEKEVFSENFERWLPRVKAVIIELHDSLKPGCTTSFFKAMATNDFTMRVKGENIVCELTPA